MTQSKTVLKWADGKSRVARQLTEIIPHGQRIVEPFVGGGSIFSATQHPVALINDNNPALMNFYNAVKAALPELLNNSQYLFREEFRNNEAYRVVRDEFNVWLVEQELGAMPKLNVKQAANFLYLNKFGFNGLYRTNKKGAFNVPFGAVYHLPKLPIDNLTQMGVRLRNTVITCQDFQLSFEQTVSGDVVVADPPGFNSYKSDDGTAYKSIGHFADAERIQLIELARAAQQRGVSSVVLQNDSEAARALVVGAEMSTLPMFSSLSAGGTGRAPRQLLIAIYKA